MPNSYFQFKKFRVEQGQTPMKVTTEACLFGAWAASFLKDRKGSMLDIGTGTGLLSLMIAQVSGLTIDAVEIHEPAANQAMKNFSNSPWGSRLKIFHQDINHFPLQSSVNYDVILTNPPFFKQHYKGRGEGENIAKHQDVLTLEQLAKGIERLSHAKTEVFVLLPPQESELFKELMSAKGWCEANVCQVKDDPTKPIIRHFSRYFKAETQKDAEELTIKTSAANKYTAETTALLKPYYLHL